LTSNNRIVLSSDHSGVSLRQTIAVHLSAKGWTVVDIGPLSSESTPYPEHGAAAAKLVASGNCRFGIVLCGTGQGIMMAANKIKGIRCGVCNETFSARMIRQHNDANMLSLGVRVVGEGLALDIIDAFLMAEFEGGRHATRVEMLLTMEGESRSQ
jgi:ribose 5-phosphate isomerase B